MGESKLDLLSKEDLETIISNSSCFEEVCEKIGYKLINPSLKDRLISLCCTYGIDYSVLNIHKKKTHKICTKCKRNKKISDFYKDMAICKDCVKEKERKKYQEKMKILNNYKKTLCCLKCGENRYYLLDFHHMDPNLKDYTISDNGHASIDTIFKEISKCVPLCANCHREFHIFNSKTGLTIEEYLK